MTFGTLRGLAFWRRVHLWIGVLAGLVFVVLGLSGSVLVYQEELLDLLYGDRFRVAVGQNPAPPSALLAAARPEAVARGARVSVLRYPDRPDRPVRAVLALPGGANETLLLDPYKASVLGPLPGGFFPWTFDLHSRLLLGPDGKAAVGWLGLVFTALALSGLVLWWPRGRQWRRALCIAWKGGLFRLSFDLHKAGGALASIPFVLLGLSGSALVFREPLLPAMLALGGSTPLRLTPPAAEPRSIDAMLDAARAELPGAAVVFVIPPARPDGPTRIRLRLPDEIHQNGRSYALFDGRGRLIELQRAPTLPAANIAFDQLPYPLHTGVILGEVGRVLVFLSGLLPALLFATGVYLWVKRGARV